MVKLPTGKRADKVVYQDKSGKDRFFVFTEPGMVDKWRRDKSTPLVEVVQAFSVFEVENGGLTGHAEKPSKAQLFNTFELSDEAAIIERILEGGRVVHDTHANATSKGYVAR